MTKTVGMYQGSLDHIGERLDALGLDLRILPMNGDGKFLIDGAEVAPEEVDVDYFWLSPHIGRDGAKDAVFEAVLACRSVDVVQTFNAGLDDPVYRRMADKGIRICNSSAQGIAIAEYVLGQVMSVFQPIEQQRAQQVARSWDKTPYREISQSEWLIVGYGPIGQALTHRLHAFGAGISVVRRSAGTLAGVDRCGTAGDLPEYLGRADVIALACPLNDATRGMVDAAFLAAAKPGAVLVNIARGGLIDDEALIAALDSNQISTAILDVFHTEPLPDDDPLWTHPQVRLTPHTSFAGDGVQGRWDRLFLDNIARYVRGEPLDRLVDPTDV